MKKKQRRVYTGEFKQDAVRLVVEQKRPVAVVARDLGINESLLHSWKKALLTNGGSAFPGHGRREGAEEELWQLKRELSKVTQEREILKKALAYFAKEQR